MRAAVFRRAGQPLALEVLADPQPGPADLIIKVHRCGICGTDLHMSSGHGWSFAVGTIPGHEYAGEVVEIGSQVVGYRSGDRITALPSLGCGSCLACADGNLVLCHNVPRVAGGFVMGGFGEYLRVPSIAAVRLPTTFSLADGALMEPMAVGLYGVRLAAIKPGDRILVQGAGSVALATIFWAKRLGAGRIVAVSRSERRAGPVRAMGADAFIQSGANEVKEAAAALGGAADIVFECVGAPGLLARAIEHARVLGLVASLGFCMEPDTIIPAVAAYKGVRLIFPVGYALRDFEQVGDMMLSGHVDPKLMITSVITFDELPTVFEALRGPNTQTKVQVSLAGH